MATSSSPDQPSDRSTWHDDDPDDATLERLRAICLPYPEVAETGGVGSPSFKVRDKIFAMRHPMRQPSGDRPSVWCKARPGLQAALVGAAPERFAVPPYVGHRGWIAIYLDGDVDWEELADLIEESYRMTAPKRLAAQLDVMPPGTAGSHG
jgi:predicted DNA-binding protein (MmcQ/YjbR family)